MPDRFYRCVACQRSFVAREDRFEEEKAPPEPHPFLCSDCQDKRPSYETRTGRDIGGVVTGKSRRILG
jgi:DNA-directed RNA polymerase subunit M/transcription elongation factor TFIIS